MKHIDTIPRRGAAVPGIRGSLRPHFPFLLTIAIALTACASDRNGDGLRGPIIFADVPAPVAQVEPAESHRLEHVESHVFDLASGGDVVGSVGMIVLRDGDTLSDAARHFGLGYEEIVAANPQLDPWVIADGTRALIPLRWILPKAARRGLVINLAAMRLFHYPAAGGGTRVVTYPVGIGKEGRSTPLGTMAIAQKKTHPTWRPTPNILRDHAQRGDPLPSVVPPGPDNPLGDYAMYLTAPRYLIHGTNKPYSIGLRASNGCIRLYPENIEQLFQAVPVRESVTTVNQPFLVGEREGVYYLQAYKPHEEVNIATAGERVRSELRNLERERNHSFDWQRIDRILTEQRGIPFPISATARSMEAALSDAAPIARPPSFIGQAPVQPEDPSAWRILAAETASEQSARRIAGIMNHQGPPIPARVLLVGERYHVVAGPFASSADARKAAKRLYVDLELAGRVLAPDSELAGAVPPPLTPSQPSFPATPAADMTEPEIPPPETVVPEETRTPGLGPTETTYYPEETPSTDAMPEPAGGPGTAAPDEWPSETSLPDEPAPSLPAKSAAEEMPEESAPRPVDAPLDLSVPEEFTESSRSTPPGDIPLDTPPDMNPSPSESKQATPQ